jgi:hypothetical protein
MKYYTIIDELTTVGQSSVSTQPTKHTEHRGARDPVRSPYRLASAWEPKFINEHPRESSLAFGPRDGRVLG